MVDIPNPEDFGFDIRRFFHEGRIGYTPGSFWALWGGFVTANHVYTMQQSSIPPFANPPIFAGTGTIDACLIGCDAIPASRPREPQMHERVFVYGYPGGSNALARRAANIFFHRSTPMANFTTPTWVAAIDERPDHIASDSDEANHFEAIYQGMSGGLVMSESGEAIGILTNAGPSDFDNDGDVDHQFDFVSLADVWDVFADISLSVTPPIVDTAPNTDTLVVRVDRFYSDDVITMSRIYIDDDFVCHGLEDPFQAIKIPGITRIPAGAYNLSIRTEGGWHRKYSDTFSDFHQGMLHVKNVPNFTFILLHAGNHPQDTDGCLLLGRGSIQDKAVWQSRATYERVYKLIIEKAVNNNAIIIYEDNDNPQSVPNPITS